MKLKPLLERRTAAHRNECVVLGCTRPRHGFGFCRECLTELGEELKRRPLPASIDTK